MTQLQAELTAEAGSAQEFSRLATEWLTSARDELFPGLSRGLQTDQPRLPDEDPSAPMPVPVLGPPGATWATVWVRRRPFPAPSSLAGYSARSWRRLLSGLAGTHPYVVQLVMTPLDGTGRLGEESSAVTVAVHRSTSAPRYVRFEATAGPGSGWPGNRARQEAWSEFLKTWATRLGACYGHVTDDADIFATALERALAAGAFDPPAVARCREVLRGYSWVTLCAGELAARLGGAGALAASGAFAEVTGLPGGQVFLRATPALEDYRGEAIRRVFQTLAPVLLAGRPNQDLLGGGHARLVMDADAADYR